MTAVLEFRDLRRRYRPHEEVLDGVDLRLDAGEVVGLLGRNGAGKTTLIHVAMGLLRPHGGLARVFGLDPQTDAVAIKRRVGFVSEEQILPPGMRAEQVLDYHRQLFPGWDPELENRLRERFRFDPRARVRTLSKGQARQLALVCAVSHRPELLILDEPGGGLDPAARREFLETSIQLLNESGTTILFSSHHMTDVERMADRIVLLDEHRVLLDCDLDALRERHCLVVAGAAPGTAPPGAAAPDPEALVVALSALPGCLRVRRHLGRVHAVCAGAAAELAQRLDAAGIEATAVRVPLEELFVELLGGES